MQLRRLSLRNLRSYTDATLELGPGTTLIVGDVGSGKTSLLYAVEMALFGFAEVDDAAHLVRHQSPEAEVALTLTEGEAEYELRRRFVRRVRKGRETFDSVENSYREGGARMRYSPTELRQRAIDLLGFPDNPNPRSHSDLWRWAVYIPQERMRDVLDQEPEARLEAVRKALSIEQYRTAGENAEHVAGELRQRGRQKDDRAEGLAHWVEERTVQAERLDVSTHRLEEALRAEETARSHVESVERELAEVQAARRQGEADRREVEEIDRQRAELIVRQQDRARRRVELGAESDRVRRSAAADRTIANAESDLRNRSEVAEADARRTREEVDRRREAVGALVATRSRLAEIERRLTEQGRQVDAADRELESMEAALGRTRAEGPAASPEPTEPEGLPHLDEKLRSARAEVDRLRVEKARADRDAEEFAHLVEAGVCPRCLQPVSTEGFAAHVEETRSAALRSGERLDAAVSAATSWERRRGARESYDRLFALWQSAVDRRASAESGRDASLRRLSALRQVRDAGSVERAKVLAELTDLGTAGDEVAALQESLVRQEGEVTEMRRQVEAAVRAGDRAEAAELQVVRWDADLARLSEESRLDDRKGSELADRHAAIAPRLAASAGWAEQERELTSRREGARGDRDVALGEISRTRQQADDARSRLTDAERGSAERAALLAEGEHLRALAAWFGGPFRESALRLERQMLGQAHREFEHSFARYFGTLIEDPSLVARLDQHFGPYVEVDGEWTPPAALSGGERTALALAYRLALGGVVRAAGRLKLETLILDEPTDGFSPEQVVRMGELLDELGLPQVILVSHEAGLSSVADRVVRVEKRGGTSVLEPDVRGATAPPSDPAPAPVRKGARRAHTAKLDGLLPAE